MVTFLSREALGALGWEVNGPHVPHALADTAGSERWQISRLWSTAAELTGRPLAGTWLRAVIGADGVGFVSTPSGPVRLSPRRVILVPGGVPTVTTSEGAWARYVWQIDGAALHQPLIRSLQNRALRLSSRHWQLLTGVSNALVTTRASANRDMLFLGEALDFTLAAAVSAASGAGGEPVSREERIYRDALRVIDKQYRHPSLGPDAIAARLAISKPTLYRAFQHAHTSPALEIERRRALAARVLLASTDARDTATLELVAQETGFSTPRRMRDALQRQSRILDQGSPAAPSAST